MQSARATTVVAALMLASWSQVASTQQVRGVVRDSATAAAIPGAVASLFDADGKPIARTIADEQGRYRVVAPAPAVRLQILRIGYRPREVRLPSVSADTTLTIDVSMSPVPKFLTAVRVSDRSICPDRETGGESLALWEQARAGLLATVVARTARPARVRNLVFERSIDARSGKITSQSFKRSGGTSSQPFLAVRPAAEFARYGYLLEDPGGRTYLAPDADVLLDPAFMTAHCFRLQVDDRRHPSEIGLSFVPAPGRDSLVDVTGVLWLDRSTLDLRALEYRYTGLEPAADAARSGGTLRFRMMPNGVVFIERWSILMPVLTRTATSIRNEPANLPRRYRRDAFVSGLHESGGELVTAVWPDARWQGELGRITGTVLERGTRRPVMNVRVWLEGTPDATVTDTAGAFTFDELLPGPYSLKAADTVLAEFEISQSKTMSIDVQRDTTRLTVEWRTIADVLHDLCRDERGPDGPAILGRTTTADGWPAWGVELSAAWQSDVHIDVDGSLSFRRVSRSDRSNPKGVFHLCNVPREQRIGVRATFAPRIVKDTTVVLGRDDAFGIVRITRPPL